MSAKRQTGPPLDAVAEALVLADAADIASLEDLDARAAALARWISHHGPEDLKSPAREFLHAIRDLRRDPESGPRALEKIGALFCSLDSALGSSRTTSLRKPQSERRAPVASHDDTERAAGPVPSAAPQLAEDPELIADFVTRATEHLESAEEQLITLEREPRNAEALNATFRAFHTIKGMAGFLSLTRIQALAHSAESVLDAPRHEHTTLGPAASRTLFQAVDELRRSVSELTESGDALESQDLLAANVEVPAASDEEPLPRECESGEDAVPQPYGRRWNDWRPDSVAPQAAVTRTVRVDEDRLDRLVDSIGELVIAESMVSEAAKELGGGWTRLAQQFGQMDKITRRLQEMATSLRMVPLRSTLRRMSRVARDMSVSAGKPVDFVLSGEETELDKEMVDRIADPLTHLLRNAVDHGLETPKERAAAGKPERGRIEMYAYHRGGTINIEVADDGRGIDPAHVLAVARERGLVAPDAEPPERELLQLLFEPGFSTVSVVTEVSGRGVGMDVVKRVVEGLRGYVEVASERGTGTRFTIKLPLTMAIIEGMVLRVADERYVLPLTAIERSVRPTPEQLCTTLGGRGEMLDLQDGLVPVVRLDALFHTADAEQDPTEAVVVVVSEAGLRAGLLACELLGQQQTVIKPLGDAFRNTPGLAGGAIMPDGRVGLILDVTGLVQLANSERG